mmetsp:Transcript_8904/g.25418  ORF Transcript_8904/g.25418 Transcript_8904/m.25418 type:complete len:239 (-) Transcript_8904:24-740(-)
MLVVLVGPPVQPLAVLVELSAVAVKSVGELVRHKGAQASVIQRHRRSLCEERRVQHPRRKCNRVREDRVVGVDLRRREDPEVLWVHHGLACVREQPRENSVLVSLEQRHRVLKECSVNRHVLVELGDLFVIHHPIGVTQMLLHRPSLLGRDLSGFLSQPLDGRQLVQEGLLDLFKDVLHLLLALAAKCPLDVGLGEGEPVSLVGRDEIHALAPPWASPGDPRRLQVEFVPPLPNGVVQ